MFAHQCQITKSLLELDGSIIIHDLINCICCFHMSMILSLSLHPIAKSYSSVVWDPAIVSFPLITCFWKALDWCHNDTCTPAQSRHANADIGAQRLHERGIKRYAIGGQRSWVSWLLLQRQTSWTKTIMRILVVDINTIRCRSDQCAFF